LIAIFGIPAAFMSFYTIKSGNVGIEFTLGKLTSITKEGLHFKS
jgi:regulator of protease activity HflC (stomatin/prohibitin superfamily)